MALDSMTIVLLSLLIFNLTSSLPVVYAEEKKDNERVRNESLISDISDQVVKIDNYKDALKQVIQLMQTQIAQTSGQDKATKTVNVINSIIKLNPNGPLAQSLSYLSKQQAIGNFNFVNDAAAQVAAYVANGNNEDIGQIIKQVALHSEQVVSSLQSPSSQSSQSLQPSQSSQSLQPSRISQLLAANTGPPIADAGHSRPDQTVNEGSLVTLDGSASGDPDGDPLAFAWTQVNGPTVQLSNPNEAKTSFAAPSNLVNDVELSFELTVTDTAGLFDSDTVSVMVKNTATPPPSNGIIHGAMTDESGDEDGNAVLVNRFNNLAGKKIGVAYFSDNWFDGIHFPLDKSASIRSTGAVPFIRMQNWIRYGTQLSDAGPYTHKNIIAGMFDNDLRAYAKAAKSFGTPLLIEYGVEMNINLFPWSKEGPEPYKAAYRHIVNLFREEGATNVRWAFHIDATDNNNGYKWYPGDDIVDWVGTSCYGDWDEKGCAGSLKQVYNQFASISKTAKLGIFEWGYGNASDTATTLAEIPVQYPRIKLLQIWNEHVIGDESEPYDRRINSSPQNLASYREGIANPAYVSTYHD